VDSRNSLRSGLNDYNKLEANEFVKAWYSTRSANQEIPGKGRADPGQNALCHATAVAAASRTLCLVIPCRSFW
jgi:hypothetical protein